MWKKLVYCFFSSPRRLLLQHTHLHSIYCDDENLYGLQCPVFIVYQTFPNALYQQTSIKMCRWLFFFCFIWFLFFIRFSLWAGGCKTYIFTFTLWLNFFVVVDSICIVFHKNANIVLLWFFFSRCFMENVEHWTFTMWKSLSLWYRKTEKALCFLCAPLL